MPTLKSVVALALALSITACSNEQFDGTPEPVTPSPTPPAETLPARWWQWAESAGKRNPILDATGRDCGVNQPNDVWFLAGTFGGKAHRECQIPAGRPVYFPVLNQLCEVAPQADAQDALDQCAFKPDQMSAALDGQELAIDAATSDGPFTFTAGADSFIGFAKGDTTAVAWGEWVGPLTIPRGDHTLTFEARAGTFALSVTYDLTIE